MQSIKQDLLLLGSENVTISTEAIGQIIYTSNMFTYFKLEEREFSISSQLDNMPTFQNISDSSHLLEEQKSLYFINYPSAFLSRGLLPIPPEINNGLVSTQDTMSGYYSLYEQTTLQNMPKFSGKNFHLDNDLLPPDVQCINPLNQSFRLY
jgi:hypothetical protein